MRNTPILTFINKLDREGMFPLDILADIEETLQIECAPLSWPIGMGKRFKGLGSDFILGAVGVLQFDVTMARLKAEYDVDASYEGVDYATARWVCCDEPKRLAAFEKANQANLAHDAEGNLTYLASSEWRLGFVTEQWPEITFLKTREHD